MSAPEIIDFFNEEKNQPSMLDRDFSFNDNEVEQPSNKKASKTFHNVNYDDNGIDDKVVWVTAIFVFFGIMVFLLGFWLGKTSIRNMIEKEKQNLIVEERKLEEKKTENLIISSPQETKDIAIPVETSKPPVSEVVKPQMEKTLPEINTSPKTVVKEESSKNLKFPEKKEVKKQIETAQSTKVKSTPVSAEGSYSIQVSAHTSMEKARSVEDALRSSGLYSYLVEATVNGVTYYRVRVGKFSTREEAENTLKKLKSLSYGKDSFIINLK